MSFFIFLFLGNGIVAARAVRVATEYAPEREPKADEYSPLRERLYCVLRAGGSESARWLSLKMGKMLLVKADELDAELFDHFTCASACVFSVFSVGFAVLYILSLSNAWISSAAMSLELASCAPTFAAITIR